MNDPEWKFLGWTDDGGTVHVHVPPTHIWSQGPGPWDHISDRLEQRPDIETFCGVTVKRAGVWDIHVRAFTAEFLYHDPSRFEDRPFCRGCTTYLAAHPVSCPCGGSNGIVCQGLRWLE